MVAARKQEEEEEEARERRSEARRASVSNVCAGAVGHHQGSLHSVMQQRCTTRGASNDERFPKSDDSVRDDFTTVIMAAISRLLS